MQHLAVFYTCLLFSLSLYTQNSIQIHKIIAPITIDGIADEADWKEYAKAGNFTQTRPDNGKNLSEILKLPCYMMKAICMFWELCM